ncbi:MAG: hypothetical protein ACREO5_06645, partial [Candidatus Binatia bacterium]
GHLKVVAGSSNAAPYWLIGAKNIKKLEELKGRKLGGELERRRHVDFVVLSEEQGGDGVITGPLPTPEKYLDLSYLRQAQKELGL